MMTVAYRAFLDARGRWRVHDELVDPADARADTPDLAAARAEVCDRVQAAIADLPEPVRQVVVLHYLGGLTLSQTAAAMEVREGTVKSRLNTGLGQLRSVLEGSQ
jgi:RNA polymerase sigma-70 factor (ECF subfamily)